MKNFYTTEHFYKEVITKVIDQSRDFFVQSSINEEVLIELRKLWCEKLTESGIFTQNNRPIGFISKPFQINEGYRNEYNLKEYGGGSVTQFKSEKDKTTNDNIQLYKAKMLKTTGNTQSANTHSKPVAKKEEEYDSDEEAFKKKEVEVKIDDEGEELSELTAESVKEELEGKDFLYAQYDKVHRVKSKWKCSFKDAVLQVNGKEYIFERVTGELERDW